MQASERIRRPACCAGFRRGAIFDDGVRRR